MLLAAITWPRVDAVVTEGGVSLGVFYLPGPWTLPHAARAHRLYYLVTQTFVTTRLGFVC